MEGNPLMKVGEGKRVDNFFPAPKLLDRGLEGLRRITCLGYDYRCSKFYEPIKWISKTVMVLLEGHFKIESKSTPCLRARFVECHLEKPIKELKASDLKETRSLFAINAKF